MSAGINAKQKVQCFDCCFFWVDAWIWSLEMILIHNISTQSDFFSSSRLFCGQSSLYPIATAWTTSPSLHEVSQCTAKLHPITKAFFLAQKLQGLVSTKLPSTWLIMSSKWGSMDTGSDLAVTTNCKAGSERCLFTVFYHASYSIFDLLFHSCYEHRSIYCEAES